MVEVSRAEGAQAWSPALKCNGDESLTFKASLSGSRYVEVSRNLLLAMDWETGKAT
jgi:hypothetical protein